MNRYKCSECGTVRTDRFILKSPNPFDEAEEIWGCPKCRSIDSFQQMCDEPDCIEIATCGWPSPHGYRLTCGEHFKQIPGKIEEIEEDHENIFRDG